MTKTKNETKSNEPHDALQNAEVSEIELSSNASGVVRHSFMEILPMHMAGIVVGAINSFIDGVITGQFLGSDAMAAIGLFGPIATLIGITFLFVTGFQIICGKYIASGNQDEVSALFSTCIVLLGFIGIAISLCLFFFHDPLASILGTSVKSTPLTVAYMLGYAPGVVGQILNGMLLIFLPVNNDTKRSYAGIGTMVVSNTLLNLLFVVILELGTFGLGIATSISYLCSSVVMFIGFLKKDRVVYFRFGHFRFGQIPRAAFLGLPSLLFPIGNTVKGYTMNIVLMTSVGDAGVAAMTVLGSFSALLGAIPMGCADALLALGSVYYGDNDRRSLCGIMRYSLEIGISLATVAMLVLMLGASIIPFLYFSPSEIAWVETRNMFLFFPSFLVLNTISSVMLKAYQIQQRMFLVNVLGVSGNLIMAAFAAGTFSFLGSNAAWIAFPFSEVVCITVIVVSVFRNARKVTFSLPDWMKLSKDFGTSKGAIAEFEIDEFQTIEEASKQIVTFCELQEMMESDAKAVGKLVETVLNFIQKKGFRPGLKYSMDVRIAIGENLEIRLRDNYTPNDPQRHFTALLPENATTNYHSSFGANTLLIIADASERDYVQLFSHEDDIAGNK